MFSGLIRDNVMAFTQRLLCPPKRAANMGERASKLVFNSCVSPIDRFARCSSAVTTNLFSRCTRSSVCCSQIGFRQCLTDKAPLGRSSFSGSIRSSTRSLAIDRPNSTVARCIIPLGLPLTGRCSASTTSRMKSTRPPNQSTGTGNTGSGSRRRFQRSIRSVGFVGSNT